MVSDTDFQIAVYDKAFERQGWVGDPVSLVATPRHNQQPSAALTIAADHRLATALNTPGARVVIHYRDEFLTSASARGRSAAGAAAERTFTFQLSDDWRLLSRILTWQVPAAPITGQSASEYDTVTGPAETVLKTLLAANVARLGLPVTIAPDLGRGATITTQARMHHPTDLLFPLVDQAGIGTTVRQSGSGFVVDCYTPQTWPITLSEDAGTLTESAWSLQPPEATRVVLGADGDGTARVYRSYIDAAAEALWGDVIEVFVDARDLKSTDPDFETLAAARAQTALAAAAMKSGLSLKLSETKTFTYGGTGVHVGDRLTVDLAAGTTVTEVLREATLTWGTGGVDVTPTIGDRRDDPDEITARAIAAVARQQRNQNVRS